MELLKSNLKVDTYQYRPLEISIQNIRNNKEKKCVGIQNNLLLSMKK